MKSLETWSMTILHMKTKLIWLQSKFPDLGKTTFIIIYTIKNYYKSLYLVNCWSICNVSLLMLLNMIVLFLVTSLSTAEKTAICWFVWLNCSSDLRKFSLSWKTALDFNYQDTKELTESDWQINKDFLSATTERTKALHYSKIFNCQFHNKCMCFIPLTL